MRQEDRPVEQLGPRQRLRAPREPVDRVVRVLEQVRAGLAARAGWAWRGWYPAVATMPRCPRPTAAAHRHRTAGCRLRSPTVSSSTLASPVAASPSEPVSVPAPAIAASPPATEPAATAPLSGAPSTDPQRASSRSPRKRHVHGGSVVHHDPRTDHLSTDTEPDADGDPQPDTETDAQANTDHKAQTNACTDNQTDGGTADPGLEARDFDFSPAAINAPAETAFTIAFSQRRRGGPAQRDDHDRFRSFDLLWQDHQRRVDDRLRHPGTGRRRLPVRLHRPPGHDGNARRSADRAVSTTRPGGPKPTRPFLHETG